MTTVKQENAFGLHLRSKRLEKGWSQAALAERSGYIRSDSFISQVETNRYPSEDGSPMQPGIDAVDAWAVALGEPLNEFRRLAGYPLLDSEMSRDEVLEEFTYALSGFRSLPNEHREFARKHIRDTIEFLQLLGKQQKGTAASSDKTKTKDVPAETSVNVMPEEDLPKLTESQLKAAKAKNQGKK